MRLICLMLVLPLFFAAMILVHEAGHAYAITQTGAASDTGKAYACKVGLGLVPTPLRIARSALTRSRCVPVRM